MLNLLRIVSVYPLSIKELYMEYLTRVKAYSSEIKTNTPSDPILSNFIDKVFSDKSDISKVEEYARANKVLLSSDASVKIVKLSRLGKINAAEYIKSVATGEWVAIGEKQIRLQ